MGRALRVSRALRFGCVWINDHIPLVSEMPHGGFKESGYGKDLSVYSLEDYTVVKHVMANVWTERRPMNHLACPHPASAGKTGRGRALTSAAPSANVARMSSRIRPRPG